MMDELTGNTTEELLHMIQHDGLREILQRDFAESKRVVGHMVQQSGGLINTIRKKNDQIENLWLTLRGVFNENESLERQVDELKKQVDELKKQFAKKCHDCENQTESNLKYCQDCM
jgi:polyhydroxyalkanoate synthesis regulator phasin